MATPNVAAPIGNIGDSGGKGPSPDLIDRQTNADAAFDAEFAKVAEAAKAPPEPPPATPSSSEPSPAPAQAAGDAAATAQPATTPAPAAYQTYSPEVQRLILENGGDLDKAARAFYEMRDRLNAAQASPPAPQVPAAQAPPVQPVTSQAIPDVQPFENKLRGIESRHDALRTAYNTDAPKLEALDAEIQELNERIAHPELDTDLQLLSRELAKKRSDYGRVKSRIDRVLSEAAQLRETHETVSFQRDQAAKQAELISGLIQSREAEELARYNHEVGSFRTTFHSTADAVAQAKIPTELREAFKHRAMAEANLFLHADSNNAIENPQTWLSALADQFKSELDTFHRVQSSLYSQQKGADGQINSPNRTDLGAVAQPDKRGKTVAEWDAALESVNF